MAGKYHSLSPYNYCAGNPVFVTDPDGSVLETAWDVASLAMGVKSFISNVKQGKVGAAILDGVGIALDAAAVAAPLVPGGVSAGIKATRGVDKVADALKAANKADDVADAAKGAKVTTTIVEPAVKTSRQARRQAMRDAGIPTSQQPVLQTKNASGREYRYDMPSSTDGHKQATVQN